MVSLIRRLKCCRLSSRIRLGAYSRAGSWPGPAGGQHEIGDPLSVEFSFIDALSGDFQFGLFHCFFSGKHFSEHRANTVCVPRYRDPGAGFDLHHKTSLLDFTQGIVRTRACPRILYHQRDIHRFKGFCVISKARLSRPGKVSLVSPLMPLAIVVRVMFHTSMISA